MKIHTLQRRQFVPRPIKDVFQFFSMPENLSRLTPEAMGFVILTPSPVLMKEGALIDYTVKVSGLNIRWTTCISDYAPPYRFVDVQLRGPYSFWHHTHTFIETDDGTIIEDTVRYALPFGFLGEFMHTLAVKRQLKKIFDHREVIIQHLFDGQESSLQQPGDERLLEQHKERRS